MLWWRPELDENRWITFMGSGLRDGRWTDTSY